MSIFEPLANAYAIVNTALTDIFDRDNVRCFLLKRSLHSSKFTEIEELTSGWRVQYGQTRDQIILFYASTEELSDTWSTFTHIAYGVPDDNNQLFVYQILPNDIETLIPNANSAEWRAFAVRDHKERF